MPQLDLVLMIYQEITMENMFVFLQGLIVFAACRFAVIKLTKRLRKKDKNVNIYCVV